MSLRPSEDGSLPPEIIELEADQDPQNAQLGEADDEYFLVDINTPRMWTLSLLFAVFGSSINLFFSLRYPSVSISPIIALLIAHPLGLLWDRVFPLPEHPQNRPNPRRVSFLHRSALHESSPLLSPTDPSGEVPVTRPKKIRYASRWHHLRAWLGQGRWNAKEHCCVFISSNVSFGFAFATDVIPSCSLLDPRSMLTWPLGYRRAVKILQSRDIDNVSTSAHALYSNPWVCNCRYHSCLFGTTEWNGVAEYPCRHSNVLQPSQGGEQSCK